MGRQNGQRQSISQKFKSCKIFSDSNLILIKGAVPELKTGLVKIIKLKIMELKVYKLTAKESGETIEFA